MQQLLQHVGWWFLLPILATLDGWVFDPTSTTSPEGLVEFKNPSSCKDMAITEAISTKKCECLTLCNGMVQLKQAHNYHYQIQTAMFCTRRKWCDFVVCTTVDFYC